MSLWGTFLEELLDASFNGVSLQSVTGGQITDHNFDEFPEISTSRSPISAAHRSITSRHQFIGRNASISIAVAGEFHELQAIQSRLRQLIQYKNKDLVLKRGIPVLDDGDYEMDQTANVTFRMANVVAVDMNHSIGKGTVITVEFVIDDAVGVGDNKQTLLNATGVTTAMTPLNLAATDVQGTFKEQYPVFTITINSVTNGSSPSIEIENGLNSIVIAQPFTNGDVLVVDTDELKVWRNGELIDFTGSFPFIADPQSVIYIRDTFTARNVNKLVEMYPRYI